MALQVIEKTATTAGDPMSVYELLADGSTWPSWSPIGSFELLSPGDGKPEGLGAVRLFTTGRHKSRELVVERRPGVSFAYVLETGLALRDYKAVVTLAPGAGGGATINWRSTFTSKVPGMGGLYRRRLGAFIEQCVQGLAAAGAPARAA